MPDYRDFIFAEKLSSWINQNEFSAEIRYLQHKKHRERKAFVTTPYQRLNLNETSAAIAPLRIHLNPSHARPAGAAHLRADFTYIKVYSVRYVRTFRPNAGSPSGDTADGATYKRPPILLVQPSLLEQ